MAVSDSGQAGAIEITDEMLAAGQYAAREHPLGLSLKDLARSIYVAMETERLHREPICFVDHLSEIRQRQATDF